MKKKDEACLDKKALIGHYINFLNEIPKSFSSKTDGSPQKQPLSHPK